MDEEKNITNITNNNNVPLSANASINIYADTTEPLNKVTESTLEVIKPPVKKGSEIITGLLSFVNETIDAGLHIYKENLNYYKQKCHAKIKNKIDKIPKESLTPPDIGILGETMENLKYNLDKDYIVELYSNIIARNVDSRTKDMVHPTFVSIIKDLSYNDVVLLEAIYKYQNKDHMNIPIISLTIESNSEAMDKTFKSSRYFIEIDDYNFDIIELGIFLENLIKLNLISIDFLHWLKNESIYEQMRNNANTIYKHTFKPLEIAYNCECNVGIKEKGVFNLTNLGQNLLKICLS
jgi:hypothetical protein